ncbi:MAG: TRAP transporter small permease subunit [Firmicutes bacterium]|nr:TRAP transporter small permease subunit [Bacillota bacterium]
MWGILLGLSVALRDGHHIKVDMLYNILPVKVKKWVSVFSNSPFILLMIATLILFIFREDISLYIPRVLMD